MATNFPDISAVNPDTGALWSAGDTFEDPSSGLTYTWMPPTWKASGVGESTTPDDGTFVKVVGDNMTGDLTLGTDKITLDATDGSAEFKGAGIVKFWDGRDNREMTIDNTSTPGPVVDIKKSNNSTAFQIWNTGSSATDPKLSITAGGNLYVGGTASDADNAIALKGDGTASFKGTVDTGTIDISSNSGTGCEVRLDGLVRAQRPTGSSGSAVFQAWSGNSNSAFITAGGRGSFAQVDSGNLSTGDGCRLNGNGTIEIRKDTAFGGAAVTVLNGGTSNSDAVINLDYDGSGIFKGNITATNVTFSLEPDNDANYTTTTDSEGVETRVYNGPTLDVKDRLQTKTAALEAIKAAAEDANITTLADFKSAIAAALSNI